MHQLREIQVRQRSNFPLILMEMEMEISITGIGFFDHMLNAFARHGFFDLDVEVEGDLYVDCIIRSKMSESYLEKRSDRPLEIRKGSNVMDHLCFQWMRH